MSLDDADGQAFAQRRGWYQAHVVASIALYISILVVVVFPRGLLFAVPCLTLAAVTAAIGGQYWGRGDPKVLTRFGRATCWFLAFWGLVSTVWMVVDMTGEHRVLLRITRPAALP